MRLGLSVLIVLGLVAGSTVIALAEDLNINLVSINTPVRPGDTVNIVVQTEPGASCVAHAAPRNGREFTLGPTTAGTAGRVAWKIRTDNGAHNRSVAVDIMCKAGDRQGTLNTSYEVHD